MSPSLALEKTTVIRNKVNHNARISVTELARSKGWRSRLPECDIIEVIDRGENTGWLVSNDGMTAMLDTIEELERQLEEAQVRAIVDARKGYQDWRSGDDLVAAALKELEEHGAEIEEAISGGR